jgi:hypothetical protein
MRLTILALVLAFATANAGEVHQVRYLGIHPIPQAEGGGICYIEGPHVHVFAVDKLQYRDHGGWSVFVGDPVAYGWDGPKVAYKGPHPIHVEAVYGGDPDEEYCYIEGPHFHAYAPVDGPDFKLVGGAYFYVGEPPKAFIEARPAMVRINAIYTPLVYTRPMIAVEAPVGWIGMRAEFAAPGVVVAAPGVVVATPGVVVQTPSVHVVAPDIHVGIGVNVGVGIGVGVGGGGGHHDNGRHKGHR